MSHRNRIAARSVTAACAGILSIFGDYLHERVLRSPDFFDGQGPSHKAATPAGLAKARMLPQGPGTLLTRLPTWLKLHLRGRKSLRFICERRLVSDERSCT